MRKIVSIVKKDLAQIFRNRFIAIISFMVIIVFAVVYYLLPSGVDETFKLGFYLEPKPNTGNQEELTIPSDFEDRLSESGGEQAEKGLELVRAESIDELEQMVEDDKVSAGISLIVSGGRPELVLYVSSKTPEEVTDASEAMAGEIAYALAGHELPADFQATVVGPDMVGRQIPMRDKLRVVLLSFIFMLELYGLGNLLMEEIQRKTAEAVLVTPVTLADFVSAKGMTGIIIAFSQGLLLALILGALTGSTWFSVLVLLFLGAASIVGLAFIMGAVSRDFISMVMLSLIPFVILVIPGLVVLDPGFNSPVIKAIPTYYLVEPLNGILNYQMSLSNYTGSLVCLALFAVGFFIVGFFILRRRLL